LTEQNTFDHQIVRGLEANLLSFKDDERKRVTYHAASDKSYSFKDPEEKVRAAFFVELIFMAIADRIGYDATGREDSHNDFKTILEEYRKFQAKPHGYEGC
jgi:hypothetical protein